MTEYTEIADAFGSRRKAMTVKQVAETIGLAPTTIYDMTKTNRIPHYRIGGSIRFDPRETAEWWRSRRMAG